MATLADLFNPTFLMFLGILVLVAALLVVYFESKIRDQNHKMTSMLNLISTMVEDLNNTKMELNHLLLHREETMGGNNLGVSNPRELIQVSDDEYDEDDTIEDNNDVIELNEVFETDSENGTEDEDEANSTDSESDMSSSESNEEANADVKLITIHMNNENELMSHEDIAFELEPAEDIIEDETNDEMPEVSSGYVVEVLNLHYEEPVQSNELTKETLNPISTNLGNESTVESIDYKKLQLPKLRSIVIEKGLALNSDINKLKKPELLKLLGVE